MQPKNKEKKRKEKKPLLCLFDADADILPPKTKTRVINFRVLRTEQTQHQGLKSFVGNASVAETATDETSFDNFVSHHASNHKPYNQNH